jgi:hypothetical protein
LSGRKSGGGEDFFLVVADTWWWRRLAADMRIQGRQRTVGTIRASLAAGGNYPGKEFPMWTTPNLNLNNQTMFIYN